MYSYRCVVDDVEELRLPHVYRVHSKCDKHVITVELHEEIAKIAKGDEIEVVLTKEKTECMEKEFCGKGYVVSVTKLNDKYRVIVSIGGFLVVLKDLDKPLNFNAMDELYVGVSRTS